MSTGWNGESEQGERLSSLMDGEADDSGVAAACADWKGDAAARRSWHEWQLIGDVLRSEDLAASAVHDQRFLSRLREQMAAEPVVLAPQAAPASTPGPRRDRAQARWMLPSAIAAGFALVVGTVLTVRPGGSPGEPSSTVAVVSPGAGRTVAESPLREASLREPALSSVPVAVDGRMLRDARLDGYLAAHKQFAGSSALGVPSAFLRGATVDVEPR